MNYRQFYEKYYNICLLKDIDIHHKDGNRQNNSIDNLTAVTLEEHYNIHVSQEDYGAAQAILLRMTNDNKEEIAKMASLHQKKLLLEGRHNFQKISRERRSEISRKTMNNRLAEGKGAFIIADIVENSRRAGLAAAAKKAGFLNTQSLKHGSKYVIGTYWWVNKDNEKVRRACCPGDGWIKGMKWKNKDENKTN